MALESAGKTLPAVVALDWLDRAAPQYSRGVSWGVPWPRGQVDRDMTFSLSGADGKPLPVQSWPLAYWPDGSLKWTGHALSANAGIEGKLELSVGKGIAPDSPIDVEETDAFIEVDTGTIKCRIPRQGSSFIESIAHGDQVVAREGKLVCMREDRSEHADQGIVREEAFTSRIQAVTLEQTGPVRAVVKIEGVHKAEKGDREWLPFTVRLYLHAGQSSIRMVHTFIYDGEAEKDFIAGLGLRFAVPLREAFHNRHVRFVGDGTGVWTEAVRLMTGRRNFSSREGPNLYAEQLEGKRLPELDEFDGRLRRLAEDLPVWDGYRLMQNTPGYFGIEKRTGAHSCWLEAGHGNRSLGLAYVGDVSGGLGAAVRNFWQLHPTALEVQGASTGTAELTVWLWSPEAPAMDMRHYDTIAHGLNATYEDVQPGFSTPHGVARTTEMTLWAVSGVPSHDALLRMARTNQQSPRLVCQPEYYHSIPAFGIWSLPDRSTPAKVWIEDELDKRLAFYLQEVEQRHWYGFWNYGDVMHEYDGSRHTWRYDIGGYAWDNSELVPDMWLWYSFLRTGRADIFRMAEAMTRHTGEVDVYHLGRFAGLGSRHNVRHWGCGAKEVRISQAALRRFYYYLTTDERAGDLMREVADADQTLLELDPMRIAMPVSEHPSQTPARARIGPDWLALAGNWMTEWERTEDTRYRDKIISGMESIAQMPYGLFSGPGVMGYDPETGKIYNEGEEDSKHTSHLVMIMGGAEVGFELLELIDHPAWQKAWMQYCVLYSLPEDDPSRDETNRGIGGGGFSNWHARMTAYAAYRNRDPELARRAWMELLRGWRGRPRPPFDPVRTDGPEVLAPVAEMRWISTNDVSQWSLNAIEVLQLLEEYTAEFELPRDSTQ